MMIDRNFRERLLYMWPAKVISLVAAVLLYFFISLASLQVENISVPVQYILPPGFTQSTEYPRRVNLQIQATKDQLAQLKDESFLVRADFSEYSTEGTYVKPLKLQLRTDAHANAKLLSIMLVPDQVQVRLERWVAREVPVIVNVVGKLKSGFELGEYSAKPSFVTVMGPKSRIGNVKFVTTDPISLDSRTQSFFITSQLHSPDSLVTIQNQSSVEVRIRIQSASPVSIYRNIPISLLGLPPKLVVRGQLPRATVYVRQAKTDSAGNIRLLADASAIRQAGSYTLPVFPQWLAGVDFTEFRPDRITVEIENLP